MESYAYFPSVVYRDEKPKLIKSFGGSFLDNTRDPGVPFWQSESLVGRSEFDGFSTYILEEANKILFSQGYSCEKYDLYLSSLWAQEVIRGGATDVHHHKNSQLSGWIFLEVPENGAYPIYYDSRILKGMVELDFIQGNEIVNATGAIHFNNVIEGTVLISNSWLNHQLVSGATDKPTRCLHFTVSHKEK